MYSFISCLKYTSVKPLGDRVLVKIKSSEKTVGGILLPSTAQTKPQGGEVVAVGSGKIFGQNKVELSVQVTPRSKSSMLFYAFKIYFLFLNTAFLNSVLVINI